MKKEMLIVVSVLTLASNVSGGIIVWDIDADEQGWRDLLAQEGMVAKGGWDFDLDPDYGIQGFDGPLTSAGAGPVSPGIISTDNITMNAPLDPFNNLVAVGPSAGFGNGSNAILSNYFDDSFWITFSEEKSAVEFTALTIIGSGFVEIFVNGEHIAFRLPAPSSGHRYGVIDLGRVGISSIEIFDIGPGEMVEGIMGHGVVYVPAPGALALLGAVGLMSRRRRRCLRPR